MSLSRRSTGQGIETIVVYADNASGVNAKVLGKIEFRKDKAGNFVARNYRINNKQRRANPKLIIDSKSVTKMYEWKRRNGFTLAELATGYSMTIDSLAPPRGYTNFEIRRDKAIQIDSFMFCQTYDQTGRIDDIPRYRMTVALLGAGDDKEMYEFDTDDTEMRRINLRDYLMCFQILNDKLPGDFKYFNMFTKERFTRKIWYALRTVECEEFYYQEFMEKYPGRTNGENRMRVGWDFVKYMGERDSGNEY